MDPADCGPIADSCFAKFKWENSFIILPKLTFDRKNNAKNESCNRGAEGYGLRLNSRAIVNGKP